MTLTLMSYRSARILAIGTVAISVLVGMVWAIFGRYDDTEVIIMVLVKFTSSIGIASFFIIGYLDDSAKRRETESYAVRALRRYDLGVLIFVIFLTFTIPLLLQFYDAIQTSEAVLRANVGVAEIIKQRTGKYPVGAGVNLRLVLDDPQVYRGRTPRNVYGNEMVYSATKTGYHISDPDWYPPFMLRNVSRLDRPSQSCAFSCSHILYDSARGSFFGF